MGRKDKRQKAKGSRRKDQEFGLQSLMVTSRRDLIARGTKLVHLLGGVRCGSKRSLRTKVNELKKM